MSKRETLKTHLKPIELFEIFPSKDIRNIAPRHSGELPWTVRMILRGIGGKVEDSRVLSYLLFETGYIQDLMDLGYQDALEQKDKIIGFLRK